MIQTWNDLLFTRWPVERETLRPRWQNQLVPTLALLSIQFPILPDRVLSSVDGCHPAALEF